jgi:UDP-N-acetylglucosamine 2-epimerase
MRILTIIGTRPEAIKLAPVVREIERRSGLASVVCVTGQHRELLDQALGPFPLHVDHDLDIMRPGQTPTETSSAALAGLGRLLDEVGPDMVVVQGDTTTAFCGALAGFYHGAAVAHVEAGLRTDDVRSPFPEEMNRRLIGRLADLHFAPTETARNALVREGVAAERVTVTGNTAIDALLWMRDRLEGAPPPDDVPEPVRRLPEDRPLLLITGHRRESFGGGLEAVCRALRDAVEAVPDLVAVYPVHLNPTVQQTAREVLGDHERVHLVDPLPYPAFVWLLDRARVVVSDSGGLQEEAPALGKPLLVTRGETERPEGIEAGGSRLVGHDPDLITGELLRLLRDPEARAAMEQPRFPFGDGTAARRIVDAIEVRNTLSSP